MLLHYTLQFDSGIKLLYGEIYIEVLFLFSMMGMAVFMMYMTIGYGERSGFSFGGDWFKDPLLGATGSGYLTNDFR